MIFQILPAATVVFSIPVIFLGVYNLAMILLAFCSLNSVAIVRQLFCNLFQKLNLLNFSFTQVKQKAILFNMAPAQENFV